MYKYITSNIDIYIYIYYLLLNHKVMNKKTKSLHWAKILSWTGTLILYGLTELLPLIFSNLNAARSCRWLSTFFRKHSFSFPKSPIYFRNSAFDNVTSPVKALLCRCLATASFTMPFFLVIRSAVVRLLPLAMLPGNLFWTTMRCAATAVKRSARVQCAKSEFAPSPQIVHVSADGSSTGLEL